MKRQGGRCAQGMGAALNEGRALFAKDELFGQWLVTKNLSDTNQAERAAAMWAAANQSQFEQARTVLALPAALASSNSSRQRAAHIAAA